MNEDDTASKLKHGIALRKGTDVCMIAQENGSNFAWSYVGKALWFIRETSEVSERYNFEKISSNVSNRDILALVKSEIPANVIAQIELNENIE